MYGGFFLICKSAPVDQFLLELSECPFRRGSVCASLHASHARFQFVLHECQRRELMFRLWDAHDLGSGPYCGLGGGLYSLLTEIPSEFDEEASLSCFRYKKSQTISLWLRLT